MSGSGGHPPVPGKGLVVFDLDGTLLDGYAAIGDALAHAMERFGLTPPTPSALRGMVGEGLERLLEKAVGPERAAEGVRLFRERYSDVAIRLSHLLPDVPAVLNELARAGWRMAVASNKPAVFSRQILEAKGVAGHFLEIAGPDAATPPKPHPAMLLRILSAAGVPASDAFVVGDMEIDAALARAGGCRVALVPGGSRSPEELAAVDGDVVLGGIRELPAWLEEEWRAAARHTIAP
ncbi:MAG: HAD family hydrolase [Acidobacteria bacterium]|nr:HAD family hydrolase [Acidobacteriota bacterium]MCA1612495.1 HAD family hydrolase [Acidobacteriota bacterium]